MSQPIEVQVIVKYFPEIPDRQKDQFAMLGELYQDWNAKINVISRKDIGELYGRHVLHSLGIAKVLEFLPGTDVLDIGTGGGFPGIPLAILFPETNFILVDSIGKKIKVVKEVALALGLKNVTAIHDRAENVEGQFDFVTSRAVTKVRPTYDWVKNKIKKTSKHSLKNGVLLLKGGDLTEELVESKLRYKIFVLADYFEEAFFETKKVVYVERQ